MNFYIAGQTDVGIVKSTNQDSGKKFIFGKYEDEIEKKNS